jgi:hypothetical protein
MYSRVFLKILYNLYLGIEGVAKCMVNRLRPILGELISVNQIKCPCLIDKPLLLLNIYILWKIIGIRRRTFIHTSSICPSHMKRVDSRYLKEARKRLSFPHGWVDWIIEHHEIQGQIAGGTS